MPAPRHPLGMDRFPLTDTPEWRAALNDAATPCDEEGNAQLPAPKPSGKAWTFELDTTEALRAIRELDALADGLAVKITAMTVALDAACQRMAEMHDGQTTVFNDAEALGKAIEASMRRPLPGKSGSRG